MFLISFSVLKCKLYRQFRLRPGSADRCLQEFVQYEAGTQEWSTLSLTSVSIYQKVKFFGTIAH